VTTRIFIADDHAIVRDGLKAIFGSRGDMIVVGEAADGWEAVSGVLQTLPDVALLDVSMPGFNGIEVVCQLRAQGFRGRLLMLSMHSTSEHIRQSIAAGANGYLLKESAGSELVAAVKSVREGNRYLSRRISPDLLLGLVKTPGYANPMDRLSVREREVMQLVLEGKSSAEIATLISLSPKTVETYRSRLMTKLAVGNVVELVKWAVRHQLAPPP
jgi:DNA-binding NarL/FixJ family response regulator